MKKKIIGLFLVALLATIFLAGCKKAITVKFDTDGGSKIEDITFKQNEKFTLPKNPTKEGFNFVGWFLDDEMKEELKKDTEIKESITVKAKWEQIYFNVVFKFRVDDEIAVKVAYGENAVAPKVEDIAREGYDFIKWSKSFENVKEDLEVRAIYKMKAITYSVKFLDKEGTLIEEQQIVKGKDAVAPTAPTIEGYTFKNWDKAFTNVNEDLEVKAVYEKIKLKVKFVTTDGTDEKEVEWGSNLTDIPAIPEVGGSVGYWNNTDFFGIKSDMTVNAVYVAKKDITVAKQYTHSLVEKLSETNKRWVFFKGNTYPLSNFTKEIIGNTTVAKITDGNLEVLDNGVFYMKLTTAKGASAVYMCEVKPNVFSFQTGMSYNEYKSVAANPAASSFLNKTIEAYQVGQKNAFAPDVKVIDNNSNNLENVELNYQFAILDGENKIPAALSAIGSINENGIMFKSDVIGRKIEITVTPVYAPVIDLSSPAEYKAVFVVEVNDGVNVYTDDQLEAEFGNLEVHKINIHRSITPVLRATQLNPNGTPKNYHDPIGKENGNAYARMSEAAQNNKLVVNGNYFTIKATDLPHMKPAEAGPEYAGQGGKVEQLDNGCVVTSVQTSIFYIELKDKSLGDKADAHNVVDFNNLTILGNTKTLDQNLGQMTDAEIKELLLQTSINSGSYNGIIHRSGTVNANNINIGYTVIGIFSTYEHAYLNADYVTIYSSWANGIYGWRAADINVSNSFLRNSGGAALASSDTLVAMGGYNDPHIKVDLNTKIENYVSGQEPWFVAFGLASVAGQIKSTLGNAVSQLSANNLTIIKKYTNPETSTTTEMFNFAIFSQPIFTLEGDELNTHGMRASITIGDKTTYREFDFLKKDPRVSNGSYIGLANIDLDASEFTAKYMEYISQGVPSNQAGQYALANQFVQYGTGNGYLEVVNKVPGIGQVVLYTTIKPVA